LTSTNEHRFGVQTNARPFPLPTFLKRREDRARNSAGRLTPGALSISTSPPTLSFGKSGATNLRFRTGRQSTIEAAAGFPELDPPPSICRLLGSSRRTAAGVCAWVAKRIGFDLKAGVGARDARTHPRVPLAAKWE